MVIPNPSLPSVPSPFFIEETEAKEGHKGASIA